MPPKARNRLLLRHDARWRFNYVYCFACWGTLRTDPDVRCRTQCCLALMNWQLMDRVTHCAAQLARMSTLVQRATHWLPPRSAVRKCVPDLRSRACSVVQLLLFLLSVMCWEGGVLCYYFFFIIKEKREAEDLNGLLPKLI